jgi:ribosomal silencing factor RsfS
MSEKRTVNKKITQENIKPIRTDSDVREFYLLEKLYQVMREDKKRGKRPSAKEFYLMERLYQVMLNDKNRNKQLLKS